MDGKPIRGITPEELAEIKAATRDSILAVGQKGFARRTRVLPPALSSYGSISEPEYMPVDVLIDLQRAYPEGMASVLLETIADLAGFRLVPKEQGDGEPPFGIEDIDELSKENGEAERAALALVHPEGRTNLAMVRAAEKELIEAKQANDRRLHKVKQFRRSLMRRAG
jgi:hypothetical protein